MPDTDPFFTNPAPPGWAQNGLTQFLETAHRNSWATYVKLKDDADRLERLHLLLKTAGENLTNSPDWFAGFFLLKAHSHYLAAVRLAMGCQIPETHMVLRGCLESALYGFYLHKNPASRITWLSRHNDEASKKRVKDEFKNRTMLDLLTSSNQHVGSVAETLYDRTIDYGAHPNERALSTNLRKKEGEDFVQFDYNYLHDDPLPLKLALRTCAQVAVCCLRIFQLVYKERFELLGLTVQIERASRGL
jgi:hypothetical protein